MNIEQYKPDFEKAISSLQDDLSKLRVGRASPSIVEDIFVEAYGTKTPLKQVASIASSDAKTLLIQPWDKSITKEIEKAILQSDIGINPVNEGDQIRLTVPQLTEETRKQLTKTVGEKAEKARIWVRQIRDKAKDEIIQQEKNKEITEDIRFTLLKKLDDMVKNYNESIKEKIDQKEKEIMTI